MAPFWTHITSQSLASTICFGLLWLPVAVARRRSRSSSNSSKSSSLLEPRTSHIEIEPLGFVNKRKRATQFLMLVAFFLDDLAKMSPYEPRFKLSSALTEFLILVVFLV